MSKGPFIIRPPMAMSQPYVSLRPIRDGQASPPLVDRVPAPAPSGFLSWVISAPVGLAAVANPAVTGEVTNFVYDGASFAGNGFRVVESTWDSGGIFNGDYLKMGFSVSSTGQYMPVVLSFNTAEGNGFILQTNWVADPVMPSSTTMTVDFYKILDGVNILLAQSYEFDHGGIINNLSVEDDGVSCRFYRNGVQIGPHSTFLVPGFNHGSVSTVDFTKTEDYVKLYSGAIIGYRGGAGL